MAFYHTKLETADTLEVISLNIHAPHFYLDPLSQLEIVLDAHDLTANEALDKAQQLFDGLQDLSIRRELFHF